MIINISKDFSPTTGFRNYKDGPKSGFEFFDVLLKPKFQEAINKKEKLEVSLDGGVYMDSFLNEAFKQLSKEFGADFVSSNLIVISNEWPKYIKTIMNSIYGLEGKSMNLVKFGTSLHLNMLDKSFKEQWRIALHDPAYLLAWSLVIIYAVFAFSVIFK